MTPTDYIQAVAELLKHDLDSVSEWKDALTIKSSPHNEIARLYGAMVNTETGDVWLLNNDGHWFQMSATDRNIEYLAPSVLQRLKYLKLLKPVIIAFEFDEHAVIIENA